MPLSTAAKAALCICPPAVLAGTVATVPAAKRAVHHLTRPAPKPVRHLASAPARPAATVQPDCIPAAPGAVPAVPLVTYASPIPEEPGSSGETGGGVPGPAVGALAGGTPVAVGPVVTPTPGPNVITAPVPEPATWLLLIVGVGGVGATFRLRRRRGAGSHSGGLSAGARAKALAGATLWSGSAAVEAGDMAATVAVKSMVASVAGKAMLCVCPAAVVAGTVMAVPPLRHAVNVATAIPEPAPVAAVTPALPCIEPATVPVSAAAIDGFPAAVNTVAPVSKAGTALASSTIS